MDGPKIKITPKEIRLAKGIAHRICKKWGGTATEDIESCAMLGLMKATKTYDGRTSFKSWLALIVKTTIIDNLRHKIGIDYRRNYQPIFLNYDYYQFKDSEKLQYLSNDGLENRLAAKDFIQKVDKLLDEIDLYKFSRNNFKQIFKLLLEDKDSHEIAEIMQIKVQSVWAMKSVLCRKLREAWRNA